MQPDCIFLASPSPEWIPHPAEHALLHPEPAPSPPATLKAAGSCWHLHDGLGHPTASHCPKPIWTWEGIRAWWAKPALWQWCPPPTHPKRHHGPSASCDARGFLGPIAAEEPKVGILSPRGFSAAFPNEEFKDLALDGEVGAKKYWKCLPEAETGGGTQPTVQRPKHHFFLGGTSWQPLERPAQARAPAAGVCWCQGGKGAPACSRCSAGKQGTEHLCAAAASSLAAPTCTGMRPCSFLTGPVPGETSLSSV